MLHDNDDHRGPAPIRGLRGGRRRRRADPDTQCKADYPSGRQHVGRPGGTGRAGDQDVPASAQYRDQLSSVFRVAYINSSMWNRLARCSESSLQ